MQEMNQYQLSLILNALNGVGPVTFHRLKEHYGEDLSRIFYASEQELVAIKGVSRIAAEHIAHWKNYFDIERELKQIDSLGVEFLTQQSGNYPELLKKIYDMPIGLYVRGRYNLKNLRCVGIVGTRKASTYGLKIAREFAFELAKLGFTIVSGLGAGIDTAAHEGALASGKENATVAVLGSGINIIYPRENGSLYRKIAEQSSIVSEFPINKKVDKTTFPIRNRIIAGMCSHLLVVESMREGGSMITARMANEYNRNVMVIPGRIDSETSVGCHALIREGATLIGSFDQLLEELHYTPQQCVLDFGETLMLQDPVERKIVQIIREQNRISLDGLSDALGSPIGHLLPKLQMLELRQIIRRNASGNYEC